MQLVGEIPPLPCRQDILNMSVRQSRREESQFSLRTPCFLIQPSDSHYPSCLLSLFFLLIN